LYSKEFPIDVIKVSWSQLEYIHVHKMKFSLILSISVLFGKACAIKLPFGLLQKKQYTPLIMFKVPKGSVEECDKMEKIVKSVEKDLGVKIERLDILRDRFARNLYEKVDEIEFEGKIPLLYNRESRQSIYGLESKERVKAWAQGRWLTSKPSTDDRKFIADENDDEIYIEQDLTELQQQGREKIMERTEDDSE
jgi:hypothetical protein